MQMQQFEVIECKICKSFSESRLALSIPLSLLVAFWSKLADGMVLHSPHFQLLNSIKRWLKIYKILS